MTRKKGQARCVRFWTVVAFATALLFCWARQAALVERGHIAAGGEWLVWLLPVLMWWGIDTVRGMREIAAEERGESGEQTNL